MGIVVVAALAASADAVFGVTITATLLALDEAGLFQALAKGPQAIG
jgi:hypothetical protein